MILLIVNVKLVCFMQIDFWYVRIIQQYLTESILTRDTFLKVCMILNVLIPFLKVCMILNVLNPYQIAHLKILCDI